MNIETKESTETEYNHSIGDGSDDDTAIVNVPEGGYEELTDQHHTSVNSKAMFCYSVPLLRRFEGTKNNEFFLLVFFRGYQRHLVEGRCMRIGLATRKQMSMENMPLNVSTA